jgi:hypothetical protein
LCRRREDSLLRTQCNQGSLEFHPLGERQVCGQFDGGTVTTDAGGLPLREVEKLPGSSRGLGLASPTTGTGSESSTGCRSWWHRGCTPQGGTRQRGPQRSRPTAAGPVAGGAGQGAPQHRPYSHALHGQGFLPYLWLASPRATRAANSADFPRGMLRDFQSEERKCLARKMIWPMWLA